MRRNGEMDFYKFLFAIVIVLFHSKNLGAEGESIFTLGSIGVEFFFIVSGFLMASSAGRVVLTSDQPVGPETVHFIGRKIKGVLPDVYVAWIIAFVVESYAINANLFETLRNGLFSVFELLFLRQAGFTDFAANAVTWYLSAMFLAMALLYPFLISHRKTFLTLAAPLIAIFLAGYMFQSWDSDLGGANIWVGFAKRGFLRAIMGLCLGCTCYVICEKLKGFSFTRGFAIFLAFVQMGCILFVLGWSFKANHSKGDYLLVLALAIAITIIFSGKSALSSLFHNGVWNKLGRFSLDLFLSHGFWSHAVPVMLPNMSYWQQMPAYLLASVGTALVVLGISNAISKNGSWIKGKLKKMAIESEQD